MQTTSEQIDWESAFDKFFPWLTDITNCWMPVNFYTRRDFDVIHNGFPRPPFDATELAAILTSLQNGGIIRFYKDAPYPDSQEDLNPTTQEIELELLKPQSRPVRFGRVYVSLTDHGLEVLMNEFKKIGLGSREFAEWTIAILDVERLMRRFRHEQSQNPTAKLDRMTTKDFLMKAMLSVSLFSLGLLCGFVIHLVMSQSSPKTSEHPNLKSPRGLDDVLLNSTKGWMPEIATLMSETRSLDGVVYLLNQDRARRLVDTYAVFEAMLMDPDVKGPSLCFWTDEPQHKFRNVSYFPVPLGTDFPFMDVTEPEGKDESSVLVVRYRARIRSTLAGTFYLEDQTLLGYAYMPVTDAQRLSDIAKEKLILAEP